MKIPVLIPNIFDHPFTYESEINVNKGDYITVPFGKSKKVGVVWDNFEKQSKKKYPGNRKLRDYNCTIPGNTDCQR